MINDGGPAYPVTPTDRSGQLASTEWDMSLRDYFAGQAMIGIMASGGNWYEYDHNAGVAYLAADAMIKAREESDE